LPTVFLKCCFLIREKSQPALLKTQKSLNDNLFLAIPYSNNIGFLLTEGVCISMYNAKVLGFLKEEDMPMVLLFKINIHLQLTNLLKYEKFISINGCNISYSLSANR
jgi:hypothetical protein